MITKTIVIDIEAEDANQELKQLNENTDDLANNLEDVGDKGATATSKLSKGLKSIGTALKAAGIGLVIALFAKLFEIMSRNQKVIDFFNTAMTTLEMVFNDIYNFVTTKFMPAMEAMQQWVNDFSWKGFTDGIKNTLKWFGKLAAVAGLFFSGQWKQAGIIANELFEPLVTTIKEGAGAFADYFKNVTIAAKAMTELNKQALLAEAINRGLIEQYDRQAEQLRQIRDDDTRLIEDRIEANERLGEVLSEQETLMLANAAAMVKAAEAQYALNRNTENQIALINARTEQSAILAQIEGFRSEQLVNQNSLLRERAELENEFYDDIDAMMTADLKKFDDSQKEKEATTEATNKFELSMAGMTSDLIGQIVNKDSKAAKGVAVAQATMSAYQGITSTLAAPTTIPEPFGTALKIANAALIGGMGFKNVKNIIATDPINGTPAGGGISAGGTAPSFNLVSGTGTNQITEGLKKQNLPTKAYVVSSDVSSGQELDRKIIAGASL